MTQPKQKTLFDMGEPPPLLGLAKPLFPVALLALGALRGLGQKGLGALVGSFGDDLGTLFTLTQAQCAEKLKELGIAAPDKLAVAIAADPAGLIKKAQDDLKQLDSRLIKVIPPSGIPDRLRSINGDAPKWLFVQGDCNVLASRLTVAVVGTRKPTAKGLEVARIVAGMLAPYPFLLVSGLADGIDAEAHTASLQAGIKNVAFLGHGINLTFPEETADIRCEIIKQGGAVVSEYMPDERYQKQHFVARNRLQAALADLVIPVEAASASGTAHTVRFARKYGRRLVGVKWKGAQGLVDDLTEEGESVIDITTSKGRKQLDGIFQDLAAQGTGLPYSLARAERWALREMKTRRFKPEDVDRLIDAIKRAAQQETPSNGTT